jgi:hypothetical protein
MRFLGIALLAGAAAFSEGVDSLASRLDKLQGLLREAQSQLDSLRRELASVGEDVSPHRDSAIPSGPIAGELLSARQKKLLAATRTPYRLTSAGYTYNPNLPLGMNIQHWFGPWGSKLDAGAILGESERLAGVNASLLRSLHRFSIFGGLETHLYALTGLGISWHRESFWYLSYPPGPSPRGWYDKPDIAGHWQIGAGTELGVGWLGGLRLAPEIGLQASQYWSRYQDSESWKAQKSLNPNFDSRPESDFALDFYYAFHLNFYFR